MSIRAIILAPLLLAISGCLAAKVVTVPVGIAGDVVEGAAKTTMFVGGTAVRVTGDALDGPDEKVDVKVKMKSGKTIRRTIKAKNLERELKKIGKKGRIVDVEVSPVG